ncbi:MAG: type IV toxin-antitoxin system AbiEi family antitoxin domain-containing protein [Acidimicrobiales bacterium]
MYFRTEADDVWTTGQLLDRGMSERALRRLVADGELQRSGRGIFCRPASEPAARWRQLARIELLRSGGDAVLARASAAHLHALDGFSPGILPIELNVPTGTGGRRRTAARRTRVLDPPAMIDGLPVTGIGQTLVELGSTLTPSRLPPADRVELALEAALHRRLVTVADLADVLAAAGRRRGAATLGTVLRRRPDGAPPTESYLETRMVQLLRDHGLPTPRRQVELRDGDGFIGRVDLLIGRVVIEVDGQASHDGTAAFHRDRLRWSRLQAAGYRPLVFTHDQIERTPAVVATIVGDTLAIAA